MKRALKILTVTVLAVLLVPLPETVSPKLAIVVVDKLGQPVPGSEVEHIWQQYTLERDANRETKLADEKGMVRFEERSIWSNPVMKGFGIVINLLDTGIHASFGPTSWVFAKKECELGSLILQPERMDTNVLTLHEVVLNRRMETIDCGGWFDPDNPTAHMKRGRTGEQRDDRPCERAKLRSKSRADCSP